MKVKGLKWIKAKLELGLKWNLKKLRELVLHFTLNKISYQPIICLMWNSSNDPHNTNMGHHIYISYMPSAICLTLELFHFFSPKALHVYPIVSIAHPLQCIWKFGERWDLEIKINNLSNLSLWGQFIYFFKLNKKL